MSGLGWAVQNLLRQRLRTLLAVGGIAISAAMLLDMVMLSGGIEKSFGELLLAKGYQIRLTPKGTLPFDTEATLDRAGSVVDRLRRDAAIESAGAGSGHVAYTAAAEIRSSRCWVTAFNPRPRELYHLQRGRDLTPDDTLGVLLSPAVAGLLEAGVGDTVSLVGRLDPQVAAAGVSRRLVVRGIVRWVYDYRGQPSVGTILPVMQALASGAREDWASLLLVKVRNDAAVPAVADRLREEFPRLAVYSVADLVRFFKQRLVYFRQLSYILATMSLIVTVLLITTLLTITVNERLGEIATLRAIGIARSTVVRQVLIEGTVLTVVGAALGIVLGLGTARYLDSILTSFPGLPAAFSFFVPRRREPRHGRAGADGDGISGRALPRMAGCPGPDCGHPALRGDVTGPILTGRNLRKDYPHERRGRARASGGIPRGPVRRVCRHSGPLRERKIHFAPADRRYRRSHRAEKSRSWEPGSTPYRTGSSPVCVLPGSASSSSGFIFCRFSPPGRTLSCPWQRPASRSRNGECGRWSCSRM